MDLETLLVREAEDEVLIVELGGGEEGRVDEDALVSGPVRYKAGQTPFLLTLLVAEQERKVLVLAVVEGVNLGRMVAVLVVSSSNGNHFGGLRGC